MKKNSFVEGTIIATIAIVITKVLGMLYVIPFCALIGTQGSALYAYAYNIYSLFLEVSTAGIPIAVSKLINEFNTLNKQEAKIRTFKVGKKLLGGIAIIAFLIMFIFAPQIAAILIGGTSTVNTVSDVTFVIRCVSFAILIFPFLSVSRGFFQGHNIIYVSSFSQVIEQVARVTVILGGSYLALKVFNLSLQFTVGIAVFSAFVGGICAYLYVKRKLNKNKTALFLDKEFKKKDDITNKEIVKRIIKYAIPVIIISLAFSIYNNVDMVLILRTMDFLNFSPEDVEYIATGISTWAPKISIIVTSIGLGLSSSLIPAMVEAFTLKNYKDVNHKFNKAMEIIIFVSIPMCVGIALLSKPIWRVFYGMNNLTLGTNLLAVCIFAPLFSNLFTVSNYTLQSMNKFRMVYVSAISGILINTLLDVPFMLLMNAIDLPAYYGATLATVVGLFVTVIIAMIMLRKEHDFKYKEIFTVMKKGLVPLVLMILIVVLLKLVLPLKIENTWFTIFYIGIVSIVGALVYFVVSYKMGLFEEVLGKEFLQKVGGKFKRKKA